MKEQQTIIDLVTFLAQYKIKPNVIGRICGINPGLMRQYVAGVKHPSPKTIAKINEKICIFADELKEFQITDA